MAPKKAPVKLAAPAAETVDDVAVLEEKKEAVAPAKKIISIIKKKTVAGDQGQRENIAKDQEEKADKGDKDDKMGNPTGEVLIDLSKVAAKGKKSGGKQDANPANMKLFNEDDVDYRYIMMNYDFSKNKTMAKITKYEKALLVGKRAKQIEEGANPNIKVLPGQNAIQIAEEELRQRKIPLIIKRPIGNTFEYWRPADMEVIMD